MGKLTISMAIFNCYVSLPEGIGNSGMIGKDWGNDGKNSQTFQVTVVKYCNLSRYKY